jgi:glucose/arabinose dehydrogenase
MGVFGMMNTKFIDASQFRKFLCLMAMTLILLASGLQSAAAAQSLEPVVVRVTAIDSGTKTYTFKCDIPASANAMRYWTVRPDTNDLEASFYSTDSTLKYVLNKNVLYHIGCQVQDNGQNVRGDFHIDLRTGPNTVKPNVVATNTNGLYITLTCTPPQGVTNYNMQWRMMNVDDNIGLSQFDNKDTMTTNVPYGGLWDFDCGVWDKDRSQWHQWGYPVEFFNEGPAYLPTPQGCIPGEACPWASGTTTSPPPTSTQSGCFNDVKDIPVTCNGQVTRDVMGGCREITCSKDFNTMSVVACNKPDSGPYNRFEMYKSSQAGNGVRICVGPTCIENEGFVQSSAYPICTGTTTTTPPPTNNTGGSTTGGQTCYSSVETIPPSCTGGSITTDTFNGCRTLTCTNGGSNLQVLACNKGSFFEMYSQGKTGSAVSQICLGSTCISDNGYAKSGSYPICTSSGTTQPPACIASTETCNQKDDDCDGQLDEDSVCAQPPAQTCYSDLQSIPATCTGASISQDTFNGCRTVVCGATKVLACDKGGFFEMYKQSGSGAEKICLGSACMQNEGFVKSSNYPICTGGSTSSGNQAPFAPVWFEPIPGQPDVEPDHFNLHVDVMSDAEGDAWAGTDYEIYDSMSGELIWKANKIMNLHPRNGDGVFVGSLSGKTSLLLSRDYKVRARHFASTGSTDGAWSGFVNFKTRAQYTGTTSQWTWTASPGFKVELVAKDVNLPVTLEPAPNRYGHLPEGKRPKLYFTQLYGQIGVLLNDRTYVKYADNLLNYAEFGSLPGSGEIGVVGLYADPSTGNLFVSMSYMDNGVLKGKVDKFVTNSEGTGYSSRTTIVNNIPVSPAHQAQEITRGPDGYLYMGTGDADNPQTADDWNTKYGKILKFRDDGSDLKVYAAGFRNPFGHEWRPGTNQLFVSNNGEDSNDGLYRVLGGETFGWCGSTCDTVTGTWKSWSQTVVPTALAFDKGTSGFPSDSNGDLYVVHVGPAYVEGQVEHGKRVVRIDLNTDGSYKGETPMVTYTGKGYGTPIGLVFMNDGLYFSDMFGEQGFVGYAQTKGNIYRIVPGTQTVDAAPGTSGLAMTFGPARWYPQGRNVVWECKGTGGSGNYKYDYVFGDGQGTYGTTMDNVYHTYPSAGTYTASCTVKDQANGQTKTLSTSITVS